MQFKAAIVAVLAMAGIGLATAQSACGADKLLSVGTGAHQQSIDAGRQCGAAAPWRNSFLQRVGIDEIMCGDHAQFSLARLTEPQI